MGGAVALTLALCLVTGAALADGTAFGASEFKGSSPYSSTGRSAYYHNGRFSGNHVVNGVDISAWQSANCNMEKAKAAGVDYAIMRVTWTSYSKEKYSYRNLDTSFASNYVRAKAAGMMVGVYVFSQAKNETEARNEASFAIQRLKSLGINPGNLELPVYMDYEFAGSKSAGRLYGLTRAKATSAARAFCDVVRSNGYTPGIYANTSFFRSYLNTAELPADVDLWCAQYYSRCESGVNYSKWQYSSSARISGLFNSSGSACNIDVNFWYLDPSSQMSADVKVSGQDKYNYTGSAVRPDFTVKAGDKKLTLGVDYTMGCFNNVSPGTAYAYIRGMGSYSGYKVVPYTITTDAFAAPTKIKSLKGRKKGFYIKVSKQKKAYASGYQVKYSRRKDMQESVTKTIGKKYNKVSKKITCNARHMKYYVQVRTYKKVGNARVYSKWSKIKTVKSK